ncbi:MAG: hypothetical protein B6D39_00400 [Anaerolineae bacterium UTCFX2]|jgi:probable HAF family extracellular repeat protein/T5SS/PEP-CTERM-associated repeat protein|nr:hypothetical protein [Anaerolineales bacterium]OQY95044.1 MAG: hypothetical protein B6D39_00400 [Anaerolineae bacterium UTCFX2]
MKRLWLTILLISTLLASPGAEKYGGSAPAASAQPALPAAPAAGSRYSITDLGTLGGGSEALAISNNGKVAGRYAAGSAYHAFLWDNGVMQDLGTLGGSWSEAYGVNDNGQVAGTSHLNNGYTAAFRWNNGSMQNLGTLGGNMSGALAINNSGQVAGWAINGAYQMHAFLWNGGMADLGTLTGGDTSYAYAVNDAGQVAGWGKVGVFPALSEHAFRWSGSMQDLGTLGWAHSSARGINDNGDVVGILINADESDWHAFAAQGGGMQDLGGTRSYGWDINNAGLIVGESGGQAVLWESGQMKNLNTLIAAGSGWVLQNARGINNKGQIVGKGTFNGQTRAFMLKPNAYHWTNPSGGAWHLTTNWDPRGNPGAGDSVVFDLNGQYAVDVSAVVSAPTAFSIDRMIVSSTNFVYFDNLDLNMVYDSPEEPSLEVNDGGTAAFNSGAATFSHAIIGGEPPANPNNPPIARLQVLGSGTSLSGSGRLTIGDEGVGDLFVTAGGQLSSAEARLGGLLPTGTGTADVGGDGSLWDTGNIAVGYGISGTLSIQHGGRVNSNDAYVSWGVQSEDSQVTVNSISAITNQPSMWALLGSLFVGQTEFGSVEVLDGGSLYVTQDVQIKNGELRVDGRHPTGGPSEMDVLGSVFVGGPGSANLLALWNAARGGIEGDLIIGKDGEGAAILWGAANTAHPTQLDVVDPAAGLCVIGHTYDGGVSLDDGGLFRCRNIQLGQTGMSGDGSITVDGGMVRALDVLTVGAVGGGGSGLVWMENNALVATNGTYITPNGVITGTGTLAVGFLGLQNDGTLAPGITVHYPLNSLAAPQSPNADATMAISGTLTIGPSGQVSIPLIGNEAGLYGSLAVTGSAALDGVLALNFSQGYAPKQGDTFTFLTATNGLTGTFDSVKINGLMPGFEYDLTIIDGQLVLEALNDGVAQRRLYLPLIRR